LFEDGVVAPGPVEEISLRLYDHGILIVEVLVDVADWIAARPGTLARRLDELQEVAVALGAEIARASVARYVDPVLERLRAEDRRSEFVGARTRDDRVGAGFGEALWVTRSLVLAPQASGTPAVVRHWLKDVGQAPGEGQAPVERLLSGEIDHVARWLNYVFLDGAPDGAAMTPGARFCDSWEAMRHAQFYYSALDVIDSRLSRILADSAASTARWQLERLREELVGLSQRAELVIMERQSLSKYLKRSVRAEMDAILGFWDYAELVEAPVRFKIGICDRRLADLAARRTARSSLFTDLILLGIGVTSVLGTALALTEFGRTMASDPGLARYDLGRDQVTAWFASQPADAVLAVSGVVSATLVVLYLIFRRDHGR
jgi:hypothetical protein